MKALENAAEKPTAADSQHDSFGPQPCAGHLIDYGCMSGPDQGIIEWRNIGRGFSPCQFRGVSVGVIPGGTVLDDRSALTAYDLTHPCWCGLGHEDRYLHAEHASGIGDGIPRIATGRGNQTLGSLFMMDLAGITDAANLEGSYRLEGFHLQVNRVTEGCRQGFGSPKRCCDVKGFHGSRPKPGFQIPDIL
jgi:hypothetical protein